MHTPSVIANMEDLVASQMDLLKQMKNLPAPYEFLTTLSKDKSTVEQLLEKLGLDFNLFRRQHKMLLALPEINFELAYFKNNVFMAGEDAYYHSKAHFNRILSAFHSQPSSANRAYVPEPCYTFNRRNKPSPVQTLCKRKRRLPLHTLCISSREQGSPSQQYSSERVIGYSACRSCDSSENGGFVAASLPSASAEVPTTAEIVVKPHFRSAHEIAVFKRKPLLLLRSLATSSGEHGNHSQQSSSERLMANLQVPFVTLQKADALLPRAFPLFLLKCQNLQT